MSMHRPAGSVSLTMQPMPMAKSLGIKFSP
jgi:hypothetical protein